MGEHDDDDLETLLIRAQQEKGSQEKAILWGKCILQVLGLEDVEEGLTFEQIESMGDQEAADLAEKMQSIFEMRSPPAFLSTKHATDLNSTKGHERKVDDTLTDAMGLERQVSMNNRVAWPKSVATAILTKCHLRCCVCPEHRRIADIHHIDG